MVVTGAERPCADMDIVSLHSKASLFSRQETTQDYIPFTPEVLPKFAHLEDMCFPRDGGLWDFLTVTVFQEPRLGQTHYWCSFVITVLVFSDGYNKPLDY